MLCTCAWDAAEIILVLCAQHIVLQSLQRSQTTPFEILALYWVQKYMVLSGKLCCGGFELKYPVFHCRHLFHKSCVDPWLLDHRTCPMCKMNILKALGIPVSMSQSSWAGQKGNTSHLGVSLVLCLSVPILLFLLCYWLIYSLIY